MLGHRLLDSVDHIDGVFFVDRHLVDELPTPVLLRFVAYPLGSISEI